MRIYLDTSILVALLTVDPRRRAGAELATFDDKMATAARTLGVDVAAA